MEKMKTICGLIVVGVFLWVTPSKGQVVSVDCSSESLQTAINSNNPWTTFNVSGTCDENITIWETSEGVTINGGGTATINGPDPVNPTVTVRTQGVTITGFTISGGIEGVLVIKGGAATIKNNIVQDTGRAGIALSMHSYATITNNTISSNLGPGISVSESSSSRIGFSNYSDTIASPNIIQNNGENGIVVMRGSSARIVGNTVSDNDGYGIVVFWGSHADISNNTINDNEADGIYAGYDSSVNLGSLTGTTIFDLPNATTINNGYSGLGCSMGASVTGRIGTLNGNSGPINSTGIGVKTSEIENDYGIDLLTASSGLTTGLIRLGNATADNTAKVARMVVRHYNNAEEPVYLFGSASTSTDNFVAFGGGSPLGNAATQLDLFTAENTTTPVGTSRITIKGNGYIGIGTQSPSYPLQMAGGAYTDGSSWINGSSREYKDDIERLTSEEAFEAFQRLDPVKYAYKTDRTEKRVGFIAEEVPDLLATKDRRGLSPMDIVAVLTKVVQEQQRTISVLSEKVNQLEKGLK